MISHCAAGVERDSVPRRNRAGLVDCLLEPPAPVRVVPQLADRALRERGRGGDRRLPRELLPEDRRLAAVDPHVCSGPAEQLDRLRVGVGGDRQHHCAACSARSCPGRSSQASIRPIVAPTTRALGRAGGSCACARCRSAAGSLSRAGASNRPSASSSAGAFTVTSRRSTGSRSSVVTSGRTVSASRAVSQGQSLGRDQFGRVRPGDADDRNAGAHEPDGEHAADCSGAEDPDCARKPSRPLRPRPGVGHGDGIVTRFPQAQKAFRSWPDRRSG